MHKERGTKKAQPVFGPLLLVTPSSKRTIIIRPPCSRHSTAFASRKPIHVHVHDIPKRRVLSCICGLTHALAVSAALVNGGGQSIHIEIEHVNPPHMKERGRKERDRKVYARGRDQEM